MTQNLLFNSDIISRYAKPQKNPYVSQGLIIINLLVFVAMCVCSLGQACLNPNSSLLIDWGANWAPLTLNGQAWRIFTACFIHIGFMHILMNMLVLWQTGIACESLFGHKRFLFIYIVSGLGGFLCSTFFNPNTVSAGASGAVIGLFGAYFAFVCAHRKELGMLTFTQTAKVLGVYILFCAIYGLTVNADFACHLGGLITGFLFGYLLIPQVKLK